MTTRKCITCHRNLSIDQYETKANKKGTFTRRMCRSCTQSQREASKSSNPESYLKNLFAQLKSSRKDSGIEWNIDIEYIYNIWHKQEGRCALSGMHMTWQKGNGSVHYSASIDRKNNDVGYIVGNIQLVCSMVNRMKHTLNDSELYWWAKNIVDYREKNL